MLNNIIAVTAPDDLSQDGKRLLLVDLSEDQMAVLSRSFSQIESFNTVITYFWKNQDDVNWLIDKKQKSDLIIFNADSIDQAVVGYMAAQSNSYFFGNLKKLHCANNRAIYDSTQAINLMEIYFT